MGHSILPLGMGAHLRKSLEVGDLEGTQQSGVAFDLKIADIARDGQLLQHVREVALKIVEQDPTGVLPENELLWRQLQALRKTNVNWAAIS